MGKINWSEASLRILRCLGKGLAEQAKVTVPGAAFVIGALSGALDESRGLGDDERSEALQAISQASIEDLKAATLEQAAQTSGDVSALTEEVQAQCAETAQLMAKILASNADIFHAQNALLVLVQGMAKEASSRDSLIASLLAETQAALECGPPFDLPTRPERDTAFARLQSMLSRLASGRES